ncbi:hypothetical protein CAEBREN_28224 [Caenorhabditis brenneri]|uniref:7TM GPCR serpentine receptor class x (Srx) domain-containing protein n=1 Tax=Caenorhabditis brenneri TaxID=135651 RepID=G0NGY0_CAEBE|nr:hypothetical protein CAEBREN_28224 [Caenorhabditis brenneri]
MCNGGSLVINGCNTFRSCFFQANVFTFVKIIWFYSKSDGRDNPENIKNIKKNIKLFFQTVLQDILFFIDNFFTYWMSSLYNHRFWYFICATFVWQTMHVIDGFVMIMFSDRFSIFKKAFTSSNSAPVSVIAEASYVKVQPRRSPLPSVS